MNLSPDRRTWRLAFAIPGAAAFLYFAVEGKWKAAIWVLIVVGFVSGKGIMQIALMRGRQDGEWTPYDELRLEAAGIGFLGVVFFVVGVVLLCHLMSTGGNRYVIAGLCFAGTIISAWFVRRNFKHPPAEFQPYVKRTGEKGPGSSAD